MTDFRCSAEDVDESAGVRGDLLETVLREQWCNGCSRPRSEWGPVCPGMLTGDWTHYHSPEWWRKRLGA